MHPGSHIHRAIAHDTETRRIAAARASRLAHIARRREADEAPRPALRPPSLRRRILGAQRHGA